MARAIAKVDGLVLDGARLVTRRRLLRNAGAVAFGTALSTAFFGIRPYKAYANHVNTICGPSPYCRSNRCDGYHCHSTDRTRYRKYGQDRCSHDKGVKNCWTTCRNARNYRCCDCCADSNQGKQLGEKHHPDGERCYGCPGNRHWYRCICRGNSIGKGPCPP
jgi:hypothetical protein